MMLKQKERPALHRRPAMCSLLIPLKAKDKKPWVPKGTSLNTKFNTEDFKSGCNYGLRIGKQIPSGGFIGCIDFDSPDFEKLQALLRILGIENTLIVKTGGEHNGFHAYFKTEKQFKENFSGKINNIGIEVFTYDGNGKYTVIPPSTVNNRYEVIQPNVDINSPDDFIETLHLASPITQENFNILKALIKPQHSRHKKKENTTLQPSTYGQVNKEKSTWLTSNYYQYQLLVSDKLLWTELIKMLSVAMYGESQQEAVERGSFRCILHYEDNPSAGIKEMKDGTIIYTDFHERSSFIERKGEKSLGNSLKHLSLFEVVHAWKTGKIEALSGKAFKEAVIETLKLIEEKGIITEFGKEFIEWRDDFLLRVNKALRAEEASIITSSLNILPAVLDIAFRQANAGHSEFVASARHVAKKAGVSTYTAGKCLGFLVALGIIERKKVKMLKNGVTFMLSINKDISINEMRSNWLQLKEIGISSLKSFNQFNEDLKLLLGERFDNIFTREPDKKKVKRTVEDKPKEEKERMKASYFEPWGSLYKRGVNDEMESGGENGLPGAEDTGNEGRPEFLGNDTNKRTAGSVISLGVGFSDSRGVRSRAGTS